MFHLDIAPVNLIDLLLVLLIFFVTTTSFLQLKVIELNLPHANNTHVEYKKKLTYVVNIKQNCTLFFNAKEVTKQELSNSIKTTYNANKKSIYQIGADENSPHKCFVEVLDIFQQNSIENISILTKELK
ncbi:ExbD/TolR family protein [Sulfurimonas sp.]|uniref:ExbD/TolR family protein n=1 Tax=Sulfurimonas sp. TaxID=2022749 RepID=UPI003D0B8BEA